MLILTEGQENNETVEPTSMEDVFSNVATSFKEDGEDKKTTPEGTTKSDDTTDEVDNKNNGEKESSTNEEKSSKETKEEGSKDTKSLVAALKKKDEIIKLLKSEKTTDDKSKTTESELERIADAAGVSVEQIKEGLLKKDAKAAGMTVEAYQKNLELQGKINNFESKEQETTEKVRIEKVETIIENMVESGGVNVTQEDVTSFFANVKDKHGIDLIKNPDPVLASALLEANASESFKSKIEQQALEDIRTGKTAEPAGKTVTKSDKKDKKENSFIADAIKGILGEMG